MPSSEIRRPIKSTVRCVSSPDMPCVGSSSTSRRGRCASATSSDSYVLAMLTNRLLDTKFKVVHGYPGAAEVDLGQIAVACALGYLDFRFADTDWRKARPRLSGWFMEFSQRASMQRTMPSA